MDNYVYKFHVVDQDGKESTIEKVIYSCLKWNEIKMKKQNPKRKINTSDSGNV